MHQLLSTAPLAVAGAAASGGRIDLDGATGYVVWGDGRPWGETVFSIRLMVRPDKLQSATLVALAAAGLSGGVSEFFRIRVASQNPGLAIVVETMDQSGVQALNQRSVRTIPLDRDSSIVWTDDDGDARLYINGEQDPADFGYTRPTLAAINRTLVGACLQAGAVASFFDGRIWMAIAHEDELTGGEAAASPDDVPGADLAITPISNQTHLLKLEEVEPDVAVTATARRDVLASIALGMSPAVNQDKAGFPVAVRPDVVISALPSKEIIGLPAVTRPDLTITVAPLFSKVALPVPVLPDVVISTLPVFNKIALPAVAQPDLVIDVGSVGAKLVTPENRQFDLEVRDPADGDRLIAILGGVHQGRWRAEINRPSTLGFRVPATAEGALEINRRREIWVRDMATNTVLDRFDVMWTRGGRDGDMPTIEVSCVGILARLGRQFIASAYIAEQKDYRTVVEEVLALQTSANPTTLAPQSGGWPTTKWSGRFQAISILEALGRLRDSAGGFFRIQNDRNRLLWTAEIKPDQANTRRLHVGMNVAGLSVETDYEAQVTRGWFYGAGEGDAQLTLLDAGHPTLYLDADNIEEEGVIEQTVIFHHIIDPAALMEAAAAYLEAHKHPVERHTVEVAEAIEGR